MIQDPGTDNRQWSVPMQCFVIEYFCFWFISSRSSCWLSWSEHLQSWHVTTESQTYTGRDKKVGAPWQHPTPPSRTPLVSQLWLWPLIGQQGPTQPAGHCLLCVDLWQTPTLIGGILTQLSPLRHWAWWLGQWPLHELSLAAETKRWHIPQHDDTHNLWHKHAAIMLTRLSFIILPCSDTSRF